MTVNTDPAVLAMAIFRLAFALMGLACAALMIWWNDVAVALRLNALLGSVGPLICLTVTLLGISSLAHHVPVTKLILVIAGAVMILLGTR